jgi:predicted alpha/beta-fold hydrolase
MFRPYTFLSGGHRQTLAGHFARGHLRWTRRTEDVIVDAPDEVRLLLRASWQDHQRDERPTLLLIHGLEGCDRSAYMLSTGEHAYQMGWNVIRMNMRGCGDGLEVCARLYHSGVSTDLLAVLEWLAGSTSRIGVCGFSLSANLTLLTLARHKDRIPREVRGAVAICPPVDLAACADRLAQRRNRLYQYYYMSKLKRSYRTRQGLLPDLYAAGLESPTRTVREYDDAIVAPYGGFRDADDYYARSSAGPLLTELEYPTLIVSPANDPMIPIASVKRWPISSSITMELTTSGGHVGFVGKTRAPGSFWAAERALDFLQEVCVSS